MAHVNIKHGKNPKKGRIKKEKKNLKLKKQK